MYKPLDLSAVSVKKFLCKPIYNIGEYGYLFVKVDSNIRLNASIDKGIKNGSSY